MKHGQPAEKFIPWQAIIYYKNKFSCGGTIISRRTILTSARCLHHSSKSWPDCYDPDHPKDCLPKFDSNSNRYTVVVGSINLKNSVLRQRRVVKVKKHPQYQHIVQPVHGGKIEDFFHDVGLVILKDQLKWGNTGLRPVCLAGNKPANLGYVSGFGRSKYKGDLSNKLQWQKIKVVNNEKCQKMYPALTIVDEHRFCAQQRYGALKYPCYGDHGGPFVGVIQNKVYVQGIISFHPRECTLKYPAIFARVKYYLKWIKKNMIY